MSALEVDCADKWAVPRNLLQLSWTAKYIQKYTLIIADAYRILKQGPAGDKPWSYYFQNYQLCRVPGWVYREIN